MSNLTPTSSPCRKVPVLSAILMFLCMVSINLGAATKSWADTVGTSENSESQIVVLHVGKGTVINLPRPASDVLISNPDTVSAILRTAEQTVLLGTKIGQSNAFFFDEAGGQIAKLELRIEHDVAPLTAMIKQHYPNTTVLAESILGDVILSGSAESSAQSDSIARMARDFALASWNSTGEKPAKREGLGHDGVVNRISIGSGEQVMLKVRVAEVSRSVTKNLGINWQAGLEATSLSTAASLSGKTLKQLIGGYDVVLQNLLGLDPGGNVVEFPDINGDNVQRTFFTPRSNIQFNSTLDSLLKALELHGFVRTLAEPTLTAVTGETASFLAGGEFPIPIAQDSDKISVEFKKFGVGLDFSPTVLSEGRISMKVATEVSDLSTNGAITIAGVQIPALTVRRANTTVELPSGGSIVMAGLLQQSTRRLSSGLPGLRNVPVLGAMFRDEAFENEETELVILVTPYIVQPGHESDFKLPTDGFAPASDLDMYLLGKMHSTYGAGEPDVGKARKALKAPVGFIME